MIRKSASPLPVGSVASQSTSASAASGAGQVAVALSRHRGRGRRRRQAEPFDLRWLTATVNDTAGRVVHEGLGQRRPVLGRRGTRVDAAVEDGVAADRGHRGRLVDECHPDGVGADCAGGDVGVRPGAHGIVETAHEVGCRDIARVVLDLDQADHVGVDGRRAATILSRWRSNSSACRRRGIPGSRRPTDVVHTVVQRREVVQHVEGGDLEVPPTRIGRCRPRVDVCSRRPGWAGPVQG